MKSLSEQWVEPPDPDSTAEALVATKAEAATSPGRVKKLTGFDHADQGNAERVFQYAGNTIRFVVESGKWIFWNGRRWTIDNTGYMVRIFVEVMKATGKQAFDDISDPRKAGAMAKFALRSLDHPRVAAGLEMLKSIKGISVSVNDLDSDPWLLGTPNGMIDLTKGSSITPDRDKLITKSIGVDFDPTATCPEWGKFLDTVTGGDTELEGYLQTAVGYTLTGSNREQCLFFLHGKGSNGKGVFSETIKRLLGDYGQTAPEVMFTKDRNQGASNDIARLAGCRLAIAAELEENVSFAESRIKALTGDDTISARFLFKELFDFRPSHHFWISGNHKPNIRGSDMGIWRRIRLLPFTVTIPDEKKDRRLVEKLESELPGILNWALEGCTRWQSEGLTTPRCVKLATDQYRAEEDVLGQFLEECTREDRDGRVLMSSMYQAYQSWTEREGVRYPLTARIFNRKLEERGLQHYKSNGGKFWKGITI